MKASTPLPLVLPLRPRTAWLAGALALVEATAPLPAAAQARVSPPIEATAADTAGSAEAEQAVEAESDVASKRAAARTSDHRDVSGRESVADNPRIPSWAPPPPSVIPPAAGNEKSGASSQTLSVPQGAGTIQGMGESFSAQLSTGIATLAVPFRIPDARGAFRPTLLLSYGSSGGHGAAGVGWDLPVAFIARQTDRGPPRYADPGVGGDWYAGQDRFVFGGGQELVPICLLGPAGGGTAPTCSGALPDEVMPAGFEGWQYFRARVEGAFQRFFWSPDHRTWIVQTKEGITTELGVPLDGSDYLGSLETAPGDPTRIFQWNVVRVHDAEVDDAATSLPVNLVQYRYLPGSGDGGQAYLTDIFYTPPRVAAATAPPSQYAHHVHLAWEPRSDPTISFRRGWQTVFGQRLLRVDVASKPFTSPSGVLANRELVRRYHLTYEAGHATLLSTLHMEGRCAAPVAEGVDQVLPDVPSCPELPAPASFGYQHVQPFAMDGTPGVVDLPGFEGFDDRVQKIDPSPDRTLDGTDTDLFDLDGDALPDVLSTLPAFYQGKHGAFYNGAGGVSDAFGAVTLVPVVGVLNANAAVIALDNPNVSPQDADGDGLVDLLHMPKTKTYAVYGMQGGAWVGRVITTAAAQSPKVDFTNDAPDIRVMDVDGDGLVDVVYTAATEVQTFLSLGRYPGGDGQFGHATWTGPAAATISNDPLVACTPWSATPVRFSDPDVRIADMNGDGLPDIVRVRKGDIRYWPGRGNGLWGTGTIDDCPGGTFGADRHVAMGSSPVFSAVDELPRLDDVNGDGLADIVQVRFNAVDIWLNVDGTAWTADRHIIQNTPVNPPVGNRVRLVDINGSGTRDILWGAGLSYRYIDLSGGERPWVLTHFENGLGKTLDLEYASSTSLMLADQAAGTPWTSKTPVPVHVVVMSTESDNLPVSTGPGEYVTAYHYRDPVYDGRQREFRGFRRAEVQRVGDANSPTSTARSTFLLGDCKVEPGQPATACDVSERWRCNPREALKGQARAAETFSDDGAYISTTHTTYRLRTLYIGRDGCEVREAFASAVDEYLYDMGPFVAAASTVGAVDVELEQSPGTVVAESGVTLDLRSSAGRIKRRSVVSRDVFGNALVQTSLGCIEGCSAADPPVSQVSVTELPAGDQTGWLWRTVESWVTGADPNEKRRHVLLFHDARGHVTDTSADLFGTLLLDRFHEDPSKSVASAPPGASVDGIVAAGHTEYDDFGNPLAATGTNGRCSASSFDDDYAELVVNETTFAGVADGECGSVPLTTQAEYDRGLEQVISVVGVRGELTKVELDGFGRAEKLFRPHPTVLGLTSGVPSRITEYSLTSDPIAQPYSLMRVRSQVGVDHADPTYRDRWSYVDGLGRTVVTLAQADPTALDGGAWIASGVTQYDAKGAPEAACLPRFTDSDPELFDIGAPLPTDCRHQRYDAFGRTLQEFDLDGALVAYHVYHALSHDLWDAEDLALGPHQGTPTTTRMDGHGRKVVLTERIHVSGGVEEREIQTTYLPTGEPLVVTRVRVGKPDAPVVRWMRYDSLGRLVLNVEPNTSVGFTPDPHADASTIKAWRYAYDDAGDLVGTSDARGCGANYHYDTAGRSIAEDYSPCLLEQADYTAPDLDSGWGAEVFQRYDAADPDSPPPSDCAIAPALLKGRLVSTADRASKVVSSYDGRGRGVCVGKRVAAPGPPDPDPAQRYAPRWYTASVELDGADRPVAETTGAAVPELLGLGSASVVTTSYSLRGTVRSIGGSYGTLVASIARAADGSVDQIVLADQAQTTTAHTYDARRRLKTIQRYRAAPPAWTAMPPEYLPAPDPSGPPSSFQLLLEDLETTYDLVSNPTEIHDWRTPSEWPAGAKPVSRTLEYDDLYRLTQATYDQAGGSDAWVSPFLAENDAPSCALPTDCAAWESCNEGRCIDRRRARPSPHVSFATRVAAQSFAYDWLGNTATTTDDSAAFYDRSLGTIQNGSASLGPYRINGASNEVPAPPDPSRTGHLGASYDAAGNLSSLAVQRNGPCLPVAAQCAQRFVYDWDEVGRLSRARRWDLPSAGAATDPIPATTADADLRYAYSLANSRVLKTAVDADGEERHTVYVFDSLELRRAAWDGTDYERTRWTEAPYLVSAGVQLARLAYEESDVPAFPSSKLHVLLELVDALGSTGIVLDRATGELVESSTYQAYGGTDSSYRPSRWNGFREDYRFTGKEEDSELGLQYFGHRYYAPLLGRWVSADPATIHDLRSDPNAYAYVHGRTYVETDPDGRNPIVVAIVIGAAVGFGASGVQYALTSGSQFTVGGFFAAAGTGALAGGVGGGVGAWAAPAIGTLWAAYASGVYAGAVAYLAGGAFGSWSAGKPVHYDGAELLRSAALGGLFSLATTAALGLASKADYPGGLRGKWSRGRTAPQVSEEEATPAAPRAAATTTPPGGSRSVQAPSAQGPAPNDYRGRFDAWLKATGKPTLPSEWDAHHRIPQEYMDHPEFADFDFHAPDNIRGASSWRNNGLNVHQEITDAWKAFRDANRNATRAEIEAFARRIDAAYGSTFW